MLKTVKSSREIDGLFEHGQRASTAYVAVLARPTPNGRGPEGRVVVIAGKKLGGAVARNRAKRVLREAIRRTGGPWPSYDTALIANRRTLTARPADIDASILLAIKKVGVL